MRGFRAVRMLVTELEVLFVEIAPSRISRAYAMWRLRGTVPSGKRGAFLSRVANIDREAGDLLASEKAAREAITACPEFWWAYLELAATYKKMGRFRDALEALEKAVASPEFNRSDEQAVRAEIRRLHGLAESSPRGNGPGRS